MEILLDKDSTIPLKSQLVEQFKKLIRDSSLKPLSPLPSIRTLEQELEISSFSIHTVYKELCEYGYCKTTKLGTFVVDSESLTKVFNFETNLDSVIDEAAKSITEANLMSILKSKCHKN